ncbi:late embryogenesis abundant protein 6 isoform X2 [Andrographis paniculata]|uniref:late embryogenesis abundant protein 6 isoform X2 n=1 Tax=Andrographis paniculata TaxID=175694 RepID=UPI0021E855DA|nr:late embryogenesis abundant protein 6 isoform X2 [Andrographis paniculata]
MYAAKQKAADAGAVAKEHVDILKAERAAARTKEGKEIAKEVRKAKEAEAKMEMHQAKAQHLEDKLHGKHRRLFGGHQAAAAAPPTGPVAPAFPYGGQPPPPPI